MHEDEEIVLGLESEDGDKEFEQSDTITLPVGIIKDGQRHRTVVIEELCGIDDHLITDKKTSGNTALAITRVLCRAIQEVEGLLARKQNPEKLFDRSLGRAMFQLDRDFVISRIFMLAGNNETEMAGKCPRCDRIHSEVAYLSDIEVSSWPVDKAPELEFELGVGFPEAVKGKATVYHKKGTLRFPTGRDQEEACKIANEAAMIDAMLAACITSVGTLGRIDQEQAKRLKTRDRNYLMQLIQDELPGMRQGKMITCTCGREVSMRVDLSAFFDGRRRRKKK